MKRQLLTIAAILPIALAGLTACGADEMPRAEPSAQVTDDGADDGSGADGGAAGGGASASCVAAIRYRDVLYLGQRVEELAIGEQAGEAVIPGCDDGGGAVDEGDPFPVYRIEGVDPSVGVATRDEATGSGFWIWYAPDADLQPPPDLDPLLSGS